MDQKGNSRLVEIMRIFTRHSIKFKKTTIPKDTEVQLQRITKSHRIKSEFPDLDVNANTWYYIVTLQDIGLYPLSIDEIDIT